MTRPKKRSVTKETSQSSLLSALQFVSLIIKSEGEIYETHIKLANNTITAFNGVLAAGIIIKENINACPHCQSIINALSKCGNNVSITQLDDNKLSIKSDKFKAIIPCIDQNLLPSPVPDPYITDINDEFKKALSVVEVLTNPNDQRIHAASILMNGQSVISSNGIFILEYWHGLSLPFPLAIPKTIAQILNKVSKKLIKFGMYSNSITFYYEDKSWIRTQLFNQEWPDTIKLFNRIKSNMWPIPKEFFNALEAVEPFSEDGFIYFKSGIMRSHSTGDKGASYEVYGLPDGVAYAARQLAILKPLASTIDFMAHGPNGPCLYFQGENVRGVIASVTRK